MRHVDVGSTPPGLDRVGRRQNYERVVLRAPIRVVYDSPAGVRRLTGELIGITETGCAVRAYAQLETDLAGRLEIDVAGGGALWLPIVTRWTQPNGHGWTLGLDFDRPTTEKREAIRTLLRRHQLVPVR